MVPIFHIPESFTVHLTRAPKPRQNSPLYRSPVFLPSLQRALSGSQAGCQARQSPLGCFLDPMPVLPKPVSDDAQDLDSRIVLVVSGHEMPWLAAPKRLPVRLLDRLDLGVPFLI